MPRSGLLKVFISYSHENEKMRIRFGHHMSSLEHENWIRIWQDRKIEAGGDWEGEINKEIATADIILLLVSASFIASPYCKKELLRAIKLSRKSKSVIPIILRPCDWVTVFNRKDYKLQALPRDDKSVAGRGWKTHDDAYNVIARELRAKIEKMRSKS